MRRVIFTLLALGAATGCGQSPLAPKAPELTGFEDVAFGSSFDDIIAITGASIYSPVGLRECRVDMPINGCQLFSRNNQSMYRTIEGIPYALELEFNKFDMLTDLTLEFERSREYDGALNPVRATISKDQCNDISERTVDWASTRYGRFTDLPKQKDAAATQTPAGNPYWLQSSADNTGFIATGRKVFDDRRQIHLFAHFLDLDGEPYCRISLQFSDSPDIERVDKEEALRKSEAELNEAIDNL